ncbi:MAG: diphosphomevalonate decarboxylase [Planctomycetes bacterium]|nr:diphosphomevalonate decarboxylase [Planctomycetota bacterium]
MSRKATASAPSNIAFIKYWGATDLDHALPANASLSMTLEVCRTTTTVQVHDDDGPDTIRIAPGDGTLTTAPDSFNERFARHLARLRERLGVHGRVEAVTHNSFPSDAGIASSASGFAALAYAISAAFDRLDTPEEMSVRARLSGSGSAARSTFGGYVMWPSDPGAPDSPATQHASPDIDLRDVIALVQGGPKPVSSLEGHRRAATSPHFATRQEHLPERTRRLSDALTGGDFDTFTELLEEETIDLHLVAMSSTPPILYWEPGTLAVIRSVRRLREQDGVPCAFTMDAGANVHVICPPSSEDAVAAAISALPSVHDVIRDRVGSGPRNESEHLF